MSKLRDKLNARMDTLQEMMEANRHLTDPVETEQQISMCSLYYHLLGDEDRDYIQASQHALEGQIVWKV